MKYRVLTILDYDNIIAFWQEVEGLSIRKADSRKGISKYLQRNQNLSFIAETKGIIVGTIMSGHDGKRGYIQHLAILKEHRNTGIATTLLNKCIASLKEEGILKSHIHIIHDNSLAKDFWINRGWHKRNDIDVFSYINSNDKNI